MIFDESVVIPRLTCQFRHSKSFHGHKDDLLKSALQKYIRRGMVQEALYAAIELELFESLVADAVGKAATVPKSLVTTFMNRLRVILAEDIGFASPLLPILFDIEYQKFEENRAADGGNPWKRRAAVVEIIKMLCAAPKIRLCSDIKAVYFVASSRETASKDPSLASIYAGIDDAIDKSLLHLVTLMPGDDPSLANIYCGLLTCIRDQSDHGFSWVAQLVDATNRGVATARRKINGRIISTPLAILFECFERYGVYGRQLFDKNAASCSKEWRSAMKKLLDIFIRYHSHFGTRKNGGGHRDHLLFAIWPGFYLFRSAQHLETALIAQQTQTIVSASQEDMIALYSSHLQRQPLVVDDFVVDMHTFAGRNQNRDAIHFVEVGAVVENEATDLLDPRYRQLYLLSKRVDSTANASKKRKKEESGNKEEEEE